MHLKRKIAEWCEAQRRASEAGNLLFEVEEQPEKLVLVRRLEPEVVRGIPLAIVIGLSIFWFASQQFTMLWSVLCVALALLISAAAIRKFWHGDVWVFDAGQSRIEHDGELVGIFDEMQCIQVTEVPDHQDDTYRYILAVAKRSGEPLVLNQIGNSPEQMLELAHSIGNYTQLPVKLTPYRNSPLYFNRQRSSV